MSLSYSVLLPQGSYMNETAFLYRKDNCLRPGESPTAVKEMCYQIQTRLMHGEPDQLLGILSDVGKGNRCILLLASNE